MRCVLAYFFFVRSVENNEHCFYSTIAQEKSRWIGFCFHFATLPCTVKTITVFKAINTKQTPLQKNSKKPLQKLKLLFSIYAFCSSGVL